MRAFRLCRLIITKQNQPAPVTEAGKKDAVMSETTKKALRITAIALAVLAAVAVVGCIVFPPASGLFLASMLTAIISGGGAFLPLAFYFDKLYNNGISNNDNSGSCFPSHGPFWGWGNKNDQYRKGHWGDD